MTTRSQKRTTVAEPASGEFEASTAENNQTESFVAGASKSPKIQSAKHDETKTSLRRKEIMSDLTKILAENQNEMLKFIASALKNLESAKSRKL